MAEVKRFALFLAKMIYDDGKTDQEIVEMYRPVFNLEEMAALKDNLKFIRNNREAVYPEPVPLCEDCLVPLNHKSVEEGCPEVMYCPKCLRDYSAEVTDVQDNVGKDS
jgi:hypothetical protein